MRRFAFSLLMLIATTAFGQTRPASQVDVTAPAPEVVAVPPQDTSALVKAAHASKAKRKTSRKKKVITNADLKKAKSKLLRTRAPAAAVADETTATKGAIVGAAEVRRERAAAEQRVSEAEKKIDDLRTELARIEQSYYRDDDPDHRDRVVRQQFHDARERLDAARQELADARDARDAVENPTP